MILLILVNPVILVFLVNLMILVNLVILINQIILVIYLFISAQVEEKYISSLNTFLFSTEYKSN